MWACRLYRSRQLSPFISRMCTWWVSRSRQRAGEAFRSEHLGPLVEGQVGGDQDGAPLVALAEDLEEEFRSGGGQGDEA